MKYQLLVFHGQKLTTSLVNVLLKFQKLIQCITNDLIFLLVKYENLHKIAVCLVILYAFIEEVDL